MTLAEACACIEEGGGGWEKLESLSRICPWTSLPGEEGGEGKVEQSRRGRVALRGAQMEEGHALFPNLSGPFVRPEGSFKSSGSSSDSMAAGYCCPPGKREVD